MSEPNAVVKPVAAESKDSHVLLAMCNPLLDISADVPLTFHDKYEVKPNNAILAEEKHLPMYQEMVDQFKVQYIAGGSAQNTVRVAQWFLDEPRTVAYIGAVGKDKFGETLRSYAEADKVAVYYHEVDSHPTGTCAVLVNNKERSLIANLGAANAYKHEHLVSDDIKPVWENAKFFYISGFFLTVSPASIMHIAEHAHASGKVFSMNLSAPFICEFFDKPLMEALEYVDFLFGNESEYKALAKKQGLPHEDVKEMATAIAKLPSKRTGRTRHIVVTQGPDPTYIATPDGALLEFPVTPVPADKIVDVNGAGDAFVGGFFSQLIKGQPLETCVRAGHYAARTILGVSGTVVPTEKPLAPEHW